MNEVEILSRALLYIDENSQKIEASPEAKMLWMKLLILTRSDNWQTTRNSRELCACLRISSSTFTKSVKQLEKSGLLEKQSIKTGKGGSSYRYHVTFPPSNRDAHYRNVNAPFLKLSTTLIHYEGLLNNAKKPSLANKLVFLVLLHFSDDFGHVSELGRAKIAEITGMNKERVKSHVERLSSLGLIHKVEPGGTIPQLMGNVSTQYYLNIWHSAFQKQVHGYRVTQQNLIITASLSEVVISSVISQKSMHNQTEPPLNAFYESSLIASVEVSIDACRVRHFFKGENGKLLASHIDLRVNDIASYLLNQHWDTIDGSSLISGKAPDKLLSDDDLVDSIAERFLPKYVMHHHKKNTDFQRNYNEDSLANEALDTEAHDIDFVPGAKELVNLVVHMAWAKAIEAKNVITINRKPSDHLPEQGVYKVLPYSARGNGIDIIVSH
ncbi:MarR family transcriptional regulator [Vibrio crassostreae]|uniref:MarR family transcriptional regulator n=1 Tax=Vibrio crassostreae TaxID=246167 RepID=UPI001B312199|nr:MarR family transcriptional regulator [Vibrio crassostreae]